MEKRKEEEPEWLNQGDPLKGVQTEEARPACLRDRCRSRDRPPNRGR